MRKDTLIHDLLAKYLVNFSKREFKQGDKFFSFSFGELEYVRTLKAKPLNIYEVRDKRGKVWGCDELGRFFEDANSDLYEMTIQEYFGSDLFPLAGEDHSSISVTMDDLENAFEKSIESGKTFGEELKKQNHVMIDIETLGTKTTSCILSIAALEFDIETKEIIKELHINVNLQTCIDAGLTVDGRTILFWLNQNEESKHGIFFTEETQRLPLRYALQQLRNFLVEKEYIVWSNSPSFDLVILKNAYDNLSLNIPWEYYRERDVRTISSLKPEVKKNTKFIGVEHNPFYDCIHQINYLVETLKQLHG